MATNMGLLTPPTSPAAKRTEPNPLETNQALEHIEGELRELPGFNEKICPSFKKDTTVPCKNPSPSANRPAAANLLHTILGLTQASPELRSKLRNLAQLAHCRSHQPNMYIKASVERWLPLFPGIPPPVPILEQLQQAFSQESRHCLVSRKQNDQYGKETEKKCENRGGRKVQNYAKTIPYVVKAAMASATGCDSEREELEYLLEVLAYNALCEEHQFHGKVLTDKWKKDITAVLKGDERPLTPPADAAGLRLSELDKNTDKAEATKDAEFSFSQIDEKDDKRVPSEHWPLEFDEKGFQLLSKTNAAAPAPPRAKLREKLQMELNEAIKETEDGFIYIYKIKGHDDLVKIGFTHRTVADRHEDWQFSCNREVICIYPETQEHKKVKYARRIEALCHKQLAHCKTEVYCDACMSRHTEWFKIDDQEAIAIVKSWSKWANSEPYEKKPNLDKKSEKERDFVWALKADQKKQLDDLPSFMQRLSLSTESDNTQAGVTASKAD